MRKYYAKLRQREKIVHRRAERMAERRRIILRSLRYLLLAALILVLGYSFLVEPRIVRVVEHDVPIKGLPWAFDGFTVVQVSDVHVGVFIRPKGVRRLVARVNAFQPDLILLTGDYVNRVRKNIEPAGRALRGLRARYGVYAVLGNHDYWADAPRMTRALQKSKIDVLFDEKRKIALGKDVIWVVGTDDVWEGKPDYEKAFAGVPDDAICLVMAHNPDAALSLGGKPVSLLLSGHTHGGHVNLPWIGPVLTATELGPKYASGMHEFRGIKLYVSPGVGSATPLRFRCPPEFTVFTLRRAER